MESKIFKLKDIVTISNLKFVHDQINKSLLRAFENFFITKTSLHLCNKREDSVNILHKKTTYGSTFSHCMQFVHEFLPKQSQHHQISR